MCNCPLLLFLIWIPKKNLQSLFADIAHYNDEHLFTLYIHNLLFEFYFGTKVVLIYP